MVTILLFIAETLGSVDLLDERDKLVFRTCDLERDKVVMQIGTACAETALRSARLV